MAVRLQHLLDRLVFRRALKRWSRVAAAAPKMDVAELRDTSLRARAMKRAVDRVLHEADYRLSLPLIGSSALRRAFGTDWSWRPELWRRRIAVPGIASVPARSRICDGASLYHDCAHSELTFRQIRNTRAEDIAPFGFRMDVFKFSGTYLSLVLDLPESSYAGLQLRHLIRLDASVNMEKPLELYARLNIKHGPNVEQIVREIALDGTDVSLEFDLAYSKVNEKRVEGMWLDLIFQGPEMNQIILHDLTVSRRPRAEI